MTFIASSGMNVGIRKNRRTDSVPKEDDDNYKFDDYNAGVSYGTSNETLAVVVNHKDARLLQSALVRLTDQARTTRNALETQQSRTFQNLEQLRRRIRKIHSYLPRDKLLLLKKMDTQGKLSQIPGQANFSPQRLINAAYRLLYPESQQSYYSARNNSNTDRLKLENTNLSLPTQREKLAVRSVELPSVKIKPIQLHPEPKSLPNATSRQLRPSVSFNFPGDIPSKNVLNKVIVKQNGSVVRSTSSRGMCRESILTPQFRVTEAFKIEPPLQVLPKKLNENTSTHQSQLRLFEPLNRELTQHSFQISNSDFKPFALNDQYTFSPTNVH